MRVMFVCTGNICRFPTCERLAAAYAAAQNEIIDFTASSAGTRAVIGRGNTRRSGRPPIKRMAPGGVQVATPSS